MMKLKLKVGVLTILLILLSLIYLTSCESCETPDRTEIREYHLGLRRLPEDFLNWWFSKVQTFEEYEMKKNSDIIEPEGWVMNFSDISNSQIRLTSPQVAYLPSRYDLRDYGLVTPVKNQGSNNTCWSFATIGSLESALLTQLGPSGITSRFPFLDPYNLDLSEQFVGFYNIEWSIYSNDYYNGYVLDIHETNLDTGGNPIFSTFNLIRRGVPKESDFPYIISSQGGRIRWNPSGNDWVNHLVKSDKTLVIRKEDFVDYDTFINTIKSAIMSFGALACSIEVYEDYYYYSGGVYIPSPGSRDLGGHAVLLIGWDDNYYNPNDGQYYKVWILKNSWGTSWGDNGYWVQPMVDETEFYSGKIPDWKIEYDPLYVPYFE